MPGPSAALFPARFDRIAGMSDSWAMRGYSHVGRTKTAVHVTLGSRWFCAALSAITIVGDFAQMIINGLDSMGALPIVFLCNLPICFFWVGLFVVRLQSEISDLRSQVKDLQARTTN